MRDRRRRAALPGRGRRRQPRVHAGGPGRVRAARRPHQHRRDRQQRRRRHLRPRGEHQDPARRRGARGRALDRRAQHAAPVDDRRDRRARAARQLPPEPCARQRQGAGARRWKTCTRGSCARSSSSKHLDRAVERLPDDETLTSRRNAGLGLTVPELAVLLAYAKITLEEELLASPAPRRRRLHGRAGALLPHPAA